MGIKLTSGPAHRHLLSPALLTRNFSTQSSDKASSSSKKSRERRYGWSWGSSIRSWRIPDPTSGERYPCTKITTCANQLSEWMLRVLPDHYTSDSATRRGGEGIISASYGFPI